MKNPFLGKNVEVDALREILSQATMFQSDRPRVSIQEMNLFVENSVRSLPKATFSPKGEDIRHHVLATAGDYLPSSDRLNPSELELYNKDQVAGLKALVAAEAATLRSEERYSSESLHNGNGDAFRHALWNSLMKHEIGQAMAKAWGDAHENEADLKNPAIEKEMDLFNNRVGLDIMVQSDTADQCIDRVLSHVRNGNMRRIVGEGLAPTNRDGEI